MRDVTPIFSPRSIAVIGATSRPLSVGWETLNRILEYGFTGAVYPVNPKAHAIKGIRTYPSVLDVPDSVDLAIIVVKRDLVLSAMEQCREKGVKGMIVITAGFKEVGGDGVELERRITQITQEAGMPMVGPNCMGAFNTNPDVRFNATFARFHPKRGPVGFISQSGAMGAQVLDFASERHFGFSKFVSIGNKSDLNENDLLEVFAEDGEVGVILLYLEDFVDAGRFREICTAASRIKPVVVLKAGRTESGAKAASSHTGALTGSDTAVDAMLESCGALRVETVTELLSVTKIFCMPQRLKGNRIAMVTNAGGPGIIATDELERAGFVLPELEERTVRQLSSQLPPEATAANPCDVLPGTGPDGYRIAIEALSHDKNIDALLVLWTCPVMFKTSWLVEAIKPLCDKSPLPVIALFSGASDVMLDAAPLGELEIPIYIHAPGVAAGLTAGRWYREWLQRGDEPAVTFEVDKKRVDSILKKKGPGWLDPSDAFAVLQAYGVSIPGSVVAAPEDDALNAVGTLRYPLVLKVISSDLLHKSDAGGVEVGIADAEELARSHRKMVDRLQKEAPSAKIEGFLVQEMAAGQVELIVGAKREPGFGPLVMCGLGGVLVEVLKDISFGLAPLWRIEPERMLRRLRSREILEGTRGLPGIDLSAAAEVIARIAQLVVDYPRIDQLDINPLLAGPEGCTAVDVRVNILGE